MRSSFFWSRCYHSASRAFFHKFAEVLNALSDNQAPSSATAAVQSCLSLLWNHMSEETVAHVVSMVCFNEFKTLNHQKVCNEALGSFPGRESLLVWLMNVELMIHCETLCRWHTEKIELLWPEILHTFPALTIHIVKRRLSSSAAEEQQAVRCNFYFYFLILKMWIKITNDVSSLVRHSGSMVMVDLYRQCLDMTATLLGFSFITGLV